MKNRRLFCLPKRKRAGGHTCSFYNRRKLLLYDLLTVVETALLANAICKIILTAVGAFSHAGSVELPNAGAALISASLRCFSLRYCHFCNLLETASLYFYYFSFDLESGF